MCSQYTVKSSVSELISDMGLDSFSGENIDLRLLPSSVAPVMVLDKSKTKLTPMRFSLVPSWSKEPKVKFATHNARIETVIEKPTWREPFKSKHCVIPMTSFFESAYQGPLAGNIIRFSDSSSKLMLAAGIFDFWKDPKDEKNSFYSFSILTREPTAFILHHGHDRTPIFIPKSFVHDWLRPDQKSVDQVKSELLSHAIHPDLVVEKERALKPGWEKRA